MQGLRIIESHERFIYETDGYKIFFRRLPNPTRGRIIEENTKRGDKLNLSRATSEMLKYCLLGWSGVYTVTESGERREVPFSSDLVERIPDDVQAELMDRVGANLEDMETEGKNSKPTSDSKPETEDSLAPGVGTNTSKPRPSQSVT